MSEIKVKYRCKKCGKDFSIDLESVDMVECPNCGAKGYNISPVKRVNTLR